jgi:hypothetical protein
LLVEAQLQGVVQLQPEHAATEEAHQRRGALHQRDGPGPLAGLDEGEAAKVPDVDLPLDWKIP